MGRAFRKALSNPVFAIIVTVAAAVIGGAFAANVLFNSTLSAVATGNSLLGKVVVDAAGGISGGFVGSGGNIKSALIGGLSGAVAGFIGGSSLFDFANVPMGSAIGEVSLGRALAHGLAGGGINMLRGDKFGAGFLAGFFSKVAAPFVKAAVGASHIARVFTHAVIGGGAAALGGGKFMNGAAYAAFSYLFNQMANEGQIRNSREDCAVQCTLITLKDGTKMYVPTAVAHQSYIADQKGYSLAEEQKVPDAIGTLKATGTVADATAAYFAGVPPVAAGAGIIGLVADALVAILDKDPWALIPAGAGTGLKTGMRFYDVSKPVSEAVSGIGEIGVDQYLEYAE